MTKEKVTIPDSPAYLLTRHIGSHTWIVIGIGDHAKLQDRMGRLAGDFPYRLYRVASWPQVERMPHRFCTALAGRNNVGRVG